MNQDELIAAQAARQAEPNYMREAEQRMAVLNKRMKALDINTSAIALQEAKTTLEKFIWLRQVTDKVGEAAHGIAPCKAGCSACCHMATFISVEEARRIASATGAKLHMPGPEVLERKGNEIERNQYSGVPCTFLKDGLCSIYEYRPHACRVHYSMDRDDLLCHIVPGHPATAAPSMNTQQFSLLYLLAHGDPLKVQQADIREFFPHG